MFAVIHFSEDNSVCVVGENSKDLKVNGDFQYGTNVKMLWDNVLYNGAIIKTGEYNFTIIFHHYPVLNKLDSVNCK